MNQSIVPQAANRLSATASTSQIEYIQSLQKPFLIEPLQGLVIDGCARRVTWDFSKAKFKTLEILHMTDLQFGSKDCNEAKLKEYLDFIVAEPNRYMVLGGDCIDAAHALSVANPHDNKWPVSVQVFRFAEFLAPYRHRVLGYVGGNHERRAQTQYGDLGQTIANLLGLPYSPGKQWIDIKFGSHKPFRIGLFHGSGSGTTKGSISNAVYRFMCIGNAHLYLVGHLHQANVIYEWRELCTGQTEIELQKIAGAMSTSFLSHYGSYSEVKGYRASDAMMARCILEPNGKWEVTLR